MELNIGDKAPEFECKDQHGNTVRLSDYRGKKVIMYFYPKDDTSGCTAQACNLRDNYSDLQQEGYEVIGVSTDSEQSHQKFIGKYALPFTLLADTDKKIVEQYGVWQEKSMYGRKYMGTMRYTFVLDEDGMIRDIIKKAKTADHTAQIMAK